METTISAFQKDVDAINNSAGAFVEISEDTYFDFLGSVPPIRTDFGFANSEPYTHNGNVPVYYCFAEIDGKYYGTLATIKGANEAYLTAIKTA